jgi:hypothetical protein
MTPADIANKPVHPFVATVPGFGPCQHHGLTFRELAAMHAQAAMIASGYCGLTARETASGAVAHADELCLALAKPDAPAISQEQPRCS